MFILLANLILRLLAIIFEVLLHVLAWVAHLVTSNLLWWFSSAEQTLCMVVFSLLCVEDIVWQSETPFLSPVKHRVDPKTNINLDTAGMIRVWQNEHNYKNTMLFVWFDFYLLPVGIKNWCGRAMGWAGNLVLVVIILLFLCQGWQMCIT